MPRKFFSRISTHVRKKSAHSKHFRPLEYVLAHPEYYSPTRRSVSGGLWVGLFVGLLPIPAQTVVAVLSAVLMRVNVPIAAITVWISNPITFVPIFYFAYRIGAALLDIPTEALPAELDWVWIGEKMVLLWKPLVLGSLILALSVSSIVYVLVSAVWYISTLHRYRRRHGRSIRSIRGGQKNNTDGR